MSTYKPYPIYDMKSGLVLARKPWLLPGDAFSKLKNAYLRQGRIEKRRGYTEFAELCDFDAQDYTGYVEVDAGGTITLAANLFTNAVTTMAHETYVYKDFGVDYFDGDFEIQFKINITVIDAGAIMFPWMLANVIDDAKGIDDANGDYLAIAAVASGAGYTLATAEVDGGAPYGSLASALLDLATDYWCTVRRDESVMPFGTLYLDIYSDVNRANLIETVSFLLHTGKKDFRYLYPFSVYKTGGAQDTSWTTSDLTLISCPGSAVMGIHTHYENDGTQELMALNTTRMHRFNSAGDRFEDVTGADTFTGGDANFFHFCNYNDVFYVTNNIDNIHTWNGAAVAAFNPGTGGGNTVDACLMAFNYKERLVLLRTTESVDGTCPQRARWPIAGGVDFTNDGYADAPTHEFIMSACFLGDDLIVFFENSVWALKYTRDSTLPFRWEKIDAYKGSYSTFSVNGDHDQAIALAKDNLIGCDGLRVYNIDEKIPDFSLSIALDKHEYCYAATVDVLHQKWLSYPESGQDYSNMILSLNTYEGNWATHEIAMHCFGYYQNAYDPTWDEIEDVWDGIEDVWDNIGSPSFPIMLGGDRNGYIYQMNDGYTDNGTSIVFDVESGRWNPFSEQGQKARFGYIDFLVDVDATIVFTVEFFKDQNTAAYKSVNITCDGDGGKVWKRAFSGEIGGFHRIKITHSGDQQLIFHAIIPYFYPVGRLI